MSNQISPSHVNVGKLNVLPTEYSSSFNIELSSIYSPDEIEIKEDVCNDNSNPKVRTSLENVHLISKNYSSRLTNLSTTVDSPPIQSDSLIYSCKSGNEPKFSIQTGKASAISANDTIHKLEPSSQMNKTTMALPTSDFSNDIELNGPLLTQICKDTNSTFSLQTSDSNVNTYVTSAPNSRICGKTKKLDHILELACTIMGNEDIRCQDSCSDINYFVNSSSEYKTNRGFKIHLPPQEQDKKKMLEELVMRLLDTLDDKTFEKEFNESKMTDERTNKIKSLTALSVRHRTENDDHLIEEKQKKNKHGQDERDPLLSKDNLRYTDAVKNNIENLEEFSKNDTYYFTNDLKKIENDIRSIVEFDEREMLKYLNISKDSLSDCNTSENNSDNENSDENGKIKDSNGEIKQYGRHSQWFKRVRNYFYGEGFKVKK